MSEAIMATVAVRRLAKAWFSLAHAALGLALVSALLLAISGLPLFGFDRVSLAGPAYLLHAVLAILLWPLAMAAGLLTLQARKAGIAAWGSWWLALAGSIVVLASPLLGGERIASADLPILNNPLFLGGMGTFALALGLVAVRGLGGWRWLDPTLACFMVALLAILGLLLARSGNEDPVALGALLAAAGQGLQLAYGLLLLAAWSPFVAFVRPRVLHGLSALALLPVLAWLLLACLHPVTSMEYLTGAGLLLRWASWPPALLLAVLILRDLVRQSEQGGLGIGQNWLALSLLLCIVVAVAAIVDAPLVRLHAGIATLSIACWLARARLMPDFSIIRGTDAQGPRDVRPWAIAITLLLVVGGGWLVQLLPDSTKKFSSGKHAEAQIKADVDARFQQGVVMLHAKQYEHALTAFHRVLQLAPDMPEAHVNMGFALLGLKRFKEAADFFDSATQLRPNQVNAYYGLAVALEGMGDLRGALEAMEAYAHLAKPSDPFLAKANAAIWEWRSALQLSAASTLPGAGVKR